MCKKILGSRNTPSAQISTNQGECNYMYYLNITYPLGHHHNDFMATGVLGLAHLRLHIVCIQETKEYSSHH